MLLMALLSLSSCDNTTIETDESGNIVTEVSTTETSITENVETERNEDESNKIESIPSQNTYTVIWKNYDDTVLEIDENVAYGITPSYDGATPERAATAEFTYVFIGWTPDISTVSGNITYTAQYTSTTSIYTVIWKNYDGTVLETDENVAYGITPSYDGVTPERAATAEFTYVFIGWTPDISTVSGNITYTAQYTSTTNVYTIIWKNYDGTVLETDENVAYGTTPSYDGAAPERAATTEFKYTFNGWTPNVGAVNGDVTYTAKFQEQSMFAYTETKDGYSIDAYYGDSTKIVFPSQYNGKDIVEIGSYVLYNNSNILEVVLPNTVKKIGNYSFSNCTRLYKINIPAQCQSIGNYVMMNTAIEEITLPASISQIGSQWLFKSPIEKIRFEGTPTQFVGNYFGQVNGTISLTTSGNYLEDHFERTYEESKETVKVGVSYLPKYYYRRWALKDTNRWFYASVNGVSVKIFANGSSTNYRYYETLERTESKEGGRKVYWYTYTHMEGTFALLPSTLKTIEISRNAGVNISALKGYANFLTVSYYD